MDLELQASSSYTGKLKLQEMLFPMGIYYNREKNTFRTPEIDPVAVCLSQLARETDGKLKGDKVSFNTLSPFVHGSISSPNFLYTQLAKIEKIVHLVF